MRERSSEDLDRDLDLLVAEQVDLVWTPMAPEIYGPNYQTWVEVTVLTQHLEGQVREGHFTGVATIVAKLFNAIQPARAYFGQKDAQQLIVIRRMVEDLNFPLEVVGCPTEAEDVVQEAFIPAETRISMSKSGRRRPSCTEH